MNNKIRVAFTLAPGAYNKPSWAIASGNRTWKPASEEEVLSFLLPEESVLIARTENPLEKLGDKERFEALAKEEKRRSGWHLNLLFQELRGQEPDLAHQKGRLTDKYGLFNPLEVCIEVFKRLEDAELYVETLIKRGKEGYHIRLMRATEAVNLQSLEEPVHLKWFPECDEENRKHYYKPYMSNHLREDLPPTLDFADDELLVSPYV